MDTFKRERLSEQTIKDFGDQWQKFQENSGYYASHELFAQIVGPLLDPGEIMGTTVADVGSGTGRIVNMLLAAGAAHVTAIEPSDAYEVLRKNTAHAAKRVDCLKCTGEQIPGQGRYDFVFSFGVLHHIPDPAPVVRAVFAALKPGGKIVVWLYGREGNELYLALVKPLRTLTSRLPHSLLLALSRLLSLPLGIYILACRILPLPMKDYMLKHLGRLSWGNRILTIYDQLNPGYAKYYARSEVHALLMRAGFTDICDFNYQGYSWTAVGVKPIASAMPHGERP